MKCTRYPLRRLVARIPPNTHACERGENAGPLSIPLRTHAGEERSLDARNDEQRRQVPAVGLDASSSQ